MALIRDVDQLRQTKFDVLVVGGGIYGACVARDAALRGLRVALIEKSDFGAATSANSLKIIHGGLRYLQDANLSLVRRMVAERSNWLRTAPHLVRPLKCLMPAYAGIKTNPLVLSAALKLNDLLGYDRNKGLTPSSELPPSRMISGRSCTKLLGDLAFTGIMGGAIWYDAVVLDTERLIISLLHSAAAKGAVLANYLAAEEWLTKKNRVVGVRARDALTGEAINVKTGMVVNCTGAWTDSISTSGRRNSQQTRFQVSLALNLIVKNLYAPHAVGMPTSLQNAPRQTLFMLPAENYATVGTKHVAWPHDLDIQQVPTELVDEFLLEINSAFQSRLTRADVLEVQWGFLPAKGPGKPVHLIRESRVHDHAKEDGMQGLVSVVGVKYTTARSTAEKVVDLVLVKLGRAHVSAQTDRVPVWGDDWRSAENGLNQLNAAHDPEVVERLKQQYGSQYHQVLHLAARQPALAERLDKAIPLIRAELVFAVQYEMAVHLTDVIHRRAGLALMVREKPGLLDVILQTLSDTFEWDKNRRQMEIDIYHQESKRYAL